MGTAVLILLLLGMVAVVLVGVGLTVGPTTATTATVDALLSTDGSTAFDPGVHTNLSETDMCARLDELQKSLCA